METLYFAIALLFISYGAPANADFGEDGDPGEVYFDYNRNITLNCTIPSPDKTQSYVWKKNDVGVEQIAELKGRYKMLEEGAVFSLSRSVEDDYGNYSCALGAEERAWEAARQHQRGRGAEDQAAVQGELWEHQNPLRSFKDLSIHRDRQREATLL
ncbi:hypothetical protein evm_002410 [Chilo suppressalis]|nr:hypothetical protein evm_002410 [Chilo suppressalis]